VLEPIRAMREEMLQPIHAKRKITVNPMETLKERLAERVQEYKERLAEAVLDIFQDPVSMVKKLAFRAMKVGAVVGLVPASINAVLHRLGLIYRVIRDFLEDRRDIRDHLQSIFDNVRAVQSCALWGITEYLQESDLTDQDIAVGYEDIQEQCVVIAVQAKKLLRTRRRSANEASSGVFRWSSATFAGLGLSRKGRPVNEARDLALIEKRSELLAILEALVNGVAENSAALRASAGKGRRTSKGGHTLKATEKPKFLRVGG